jgi:hypothetical protein
MMKDLMEMLAKKKADGKLSDTDKQAKMEVLEELLSAAKEAMGGKVKMGLEELMAEAKPAQVTVAAEDPEQLKEGLEMAEEMLPEGEEKEEKPEEEESEDMAKGGMVEAKDVSPAEASTPKKPLKKKKSSSIYSLLDDEE